MSKDRYKNERIELAREKVKNAETLEDIALVVTREGLDLLNVTLEKSMRRIIQEEIQKATKELALGFLKGMEPQKQLPEPKEEPRYDYREFAAEPEPEEEPGTPMFDLWEQQAQLAEERKEKIARRSTRYSQEEQESAKQQFKELKKKFPDKTDNWIIERITLPGRTNKAIINLFQRKLKGEMNL